MDNYNLVLELLTMIEEKNKDIIPTNIMVIGKTGVGKSTLINNIFRENLAETGIGRPVTRYLKKINKEGVPINLYDTVGLELDSTIQNKVRADINAELDRINDGGNVKVDDLIHLIWYCVNSTSNRLEEFEIQWIGELSKKAPVIIVLTQSYTDDSEKFEKFIDSLNLNVRGIQRVLAEPYKIQGIELPRVGLEDLVEKSFQLLPEGIRRGFANAQKVAIKTKEQLAIKYAKGYIATTLAVGGTPIPWADAPILASTQLGMLAHITSIFGVKVEKELIFAIVSGLVGVAGATITGRTIVANLIKMIPGAGTVIGGAISASTASFLTTVLAFSYIEVMKKVVSLQYEGKTVDGEKIAEMMKEELKKRFEKKIIE